MHTMEIAVTLSQGAVVPALAGLARAERAGEDHGPR